MTNWRRLQSRQKFSLVRQSVNTCRYLVITIESPTDLACHYIIYYARTSFYYCFTSCHFIPTHTWCNVASDFNFEVEPREFFRLVYRETVPGNWI